MEIFSVSPAISGGVHFCMNIQYTIFFLELTGILWAFFGLIDMEDIFHAKNAKIFIKDAKNDAMKENEISYQIIGAALKVHKNVGPGLLESAYENALVFELKNLEMVVQQQVTLPFVYSEVKLEAGYRIDLIVNKLVIVEIKSVEFLMPVHYAQLLTYLRLTELKLGLLINFNEVRLKDGIHRVVNNL
jgi:GxxExxY protein